MKCILCIYDEFSLKSRSEIKIEKLNIDEEKNMLYSLRNYKKVSYKYMKE